MHQDLLDFYATPGRFTTLGPDDALPATDVGRIVEVVQGLLIYDTVARDLYGVELSPTQAETIHERDIARVLAVARQVDPRPLTEARAPADRVGARCHLFSRLTVSFLRANGIPARARCGFGTYFVPDWYEDHWVAEYWDAGTSAWRMVEAQLDSTWRELIGFTGDPLAIDGTQFVTAGHAWKAWRAGQLDGDRCGLSSIRLHGPFWIAGNLRLDLASLNKVEMLPWDIWGEGWSPEEVPTEAQLRLFDEVAQLTIDPDATFDQLRDRYRNDDGLRMDGTVFNAGREREETV